jgi:hypothetical protein
VVVLAPEFGHDGYFGAWDSRSEDCGADDGLDAIVLCSIDEAVAIL